MRWGSTVYDKSSIMLPRRLMYFKPNEARWGGGGDKLGRKKKKKVGVHESQIRVKSDLPVGK